MPADPVEPRAGDEPDHRLSADLDDGGRGPARHGARASTCRCRSRARPARRTMPRTCGSSAIPRTSSAGCYIGYDQPRTLGGASGGGMCGPVFESFMEEAIQVYGGTEFAVPPGGYFKQDRPLHGLASARRRHGRERRRRILPRRAGQRLWPTRSSMAALRWGRTCRSSPMARRMAGARAAASTVTTSTGETKVIPPRRPISGRSARAGSTDPGAALAPPLPRRGYHPPLIPTNGTRPDARRNPEQRRCDREVAEPARPAHGPWETAPHRLEEFNAMLEDGDLWNDPARGAEADARAAGADGRSLHLQAASKAG